MRLIITDTGKIWNKDNPFLKQFKPIVTVVCLNGEKVTDEYECFISPYKNETHVGMDSAGIDSKKFGALATVAEKLYRGFSNHEDVVFLTDSEPTTLYPFLVTRDMFEYNSAHLVSMPISAFDGEVYGKDPAKLLSDLRGLDSVLYYDEARIYGTRTEDVQKVMNDLGNMMPRFLNGIYHMSEAPCYFDFASMEYIPLKDGYNSIDIDNRYKPASEIDFPIGRMFSTLGMICTPSYPDEGEDVKEIIERPVARLDGKKICNLLRGQRIKLAEANGISFRSEKCPSIGPCAGTCDKCDEESRYLYEEMQKIPRDKRVYPKFDPREVIA